VPPVRQNGRRLDLFDNLARLPPLFVYAAWGGLAIKIGENKTHPKVRLVDGGASRLHW
jgi:hypothetical protein